MMHYTLHFPTKNLLKHFVEYGSQEYIFWQYIVDNGSVNGVDPKNVNDGDWFLIFCGW